MIVKGLVELDTEVTLTYHPYMSPSYVIPFHQPLESSLQTKMCKPHRLKTADLRPSLRFFSNVLVALFVFVETLPPCSRLWWVSCCPSSLQAL